MEPSHPHGHTFVSKKRMRKNPPQRRIFAKQSSWKRGVLFVSFLGKNAPLPRANDTHVVFKDLNDYNLLYSMRPLWSEG